MLSVANKQNKSTTTIKTLKNELPINLNSNRPLVTVYDFLPTLSTSTFAQLGYHPNPIEKCTICTKKHFSNKKIHSRFHPYVTPTQIGPSSDVDTIENMLKQMSIKNHETTDKIKTNVEKKITQDEKWFEVFNNIPKLNQKETFLDFYFGTNQTPLTNSINPNMPKRTRIKKHATKKEIKTNDKKNITFKDMWFKVINDNPELYQKNTFVGLNPNFNQPAPFIYSIDPSTIFTTTIEKLYKNPYKCTYPLCAFTCETFLTIFKHVQIKHDKQEEETITQYIKVNWDLVDEKTNKSASKKTCKKQEKISKFFQNQPPQIPPFDIVWRTSQGKYLCPLGEGVCEKKIFEYSNLRNHIRVHCGPNYRPFRCNVDPTKCQFGCRQRGSVIVHIKRKHAEFLQSKAWLEKEHTNKLLGIKTDYFELVKACYNFLDMEDEAFNKAKVFF